MGKKVLVDVIMNVVQLQLRIVQVLVEDRLKTLDVVAVLQDQVDVIMNVVQ